MLDGVIFDFNGTLFFDDKYHFAVFNELKKQITGQPLTKVEMDTTYSGMPNIEIFKNMSNGKLTREQCEQLSIKKEQMYRELVRKDKDVSLCNGAIELFNLLKDNNIPFTIASASIKENIDFFVKQFKLDNWIKPDTIVYDDGSYTNKIAMFNKAKQVLNIKDNVLIFEDSLSGIKCGSAINAKLIVIDSDNIRPYYNQYPNIIAKVKDLSESMELVKSLIK